MSKTKIITDHTEPSSDEVNNKRDFAEVQSRFEGVRGGMRFKKWVAAAVAASLVFFASLVLFQSKDEPKQAENNSIEHTDQDSGVKYKLPAVPSEKFTLDPKEEINIITANGTLIYVPENAFVTREGKFPTKEIELSFTPYDDPLSVFVSGISMTYDSAGTRYGFQSGGMFELTANATEGTLELAQNKEITVYHPSLLNDQHLNVYTKANAKDPWEFESISEVSSFEEACEELTIKFDHSDAKLLAEVSEKSQRKQQLESQMDALETSIPLVPRSPNPENYTFDLDIDPKEFPEWSDFRSLTFEVVDPSFRYPMFDVVYDDISLKQEEDGSYQVRLKKGKKNTNLKVFPVLSEKERRQLQKKHEETLLELAEEKQELEDEVYTLNEWLDDKQSQLNEEATISSSRKLINNMRRSIIQERPVRKFNLSDLSIVNHDAPYLPPAGCFETKADFFVGNEEAKITQITMINLQKNAYLEYLEKDFTKLKYAHRQKHIAFTVLPDGSLGVLSSLDLREVDKEQIATSFTLSTAKEGSNFSDLKAQVMGLIE